MAQVVDGRYTARMDEPFAVFIIEMWLPLHKDPAAITRRVIRARSTRFLTTPLLFNSTRRLCSWSRLCPAVEKDRGCK
jgi:hypothetical protein